MPGLTTPRGMRCGWVMWTMVGVLYGRTGWGGRGFGWGGVMVDSGVAMEMG